MTILRQEMLGQKECPPLMQLVSSEHLLRKVTPPSYSVIVDMKITRLRHFNVVHMANPKCFGKHNITINI